MIYLLCVDRSLWGGDMGDVELQASENGSPVGGSRRRIDAIWNKIWLFWRPLAELGEVIYPTRFTFILMLFCGILLLLDQGADLLINLYGRPFGSSDFPWMHWLCFWGGVTFLAMQAWHWSRVLLSHRAFFCSDRSKWGKRKQTRKREKWPRHSRWKKFWIVNLPRFYGVAPFVFASWALYRSGMKFFWGPPFWSLAVAVPLYILMVYRKRLFFPEETEWGPLRKSINLESAIFPGLARGTVLQLAASLLAAVVFLIVFTSMPVAPATMLGAGAVVFLGAALLIAGFSFIVLLSARVKLNVDADVPVLTLLVAAVLLFSIWNDNHEVRTFSREIAPEISNNRIDLQEAWRHWAAVNLEKHQNEVPIIFVSSAGGASRAAYWTTTVLGRLQDCAPEFGDRIFSIAGVSGGAVGATVFTAMLSEAARHGDAVASTSYSDESCALGISDGTARRPRVVEAGFQKFGSAVTGRDFLAPTLAALLFPDLFQRFFFCGVLPDRAAALEKSWEHAWAQACEESGNTKFCRRTQTNGQKGLRPNPLSAPFLEMWNPNSRGNVRVPILMTIGAHQETGKRIITSNLRTGFEDDSVIEDAYDFHARLRRDVPASTAAHNAARFPLISPPGTMKKPDGTVFGHILDGGYIENNGTDTTLDLWLRLSNFLRDHVDELKGRRLRPIFIEIINDTETSSNDKARWTRIDKCDSRDCRAEVPEADSSDWSGELWRPVLGLYNARSGRGVLASKRLSRLINIVDDKMFTKPEFAQFSLCKGEAKDGTRDFAMSWVMSERSRKDMDTIFVDEAAKDIFRKCVHSNAV